MVDGIAKRTKVLEMVCDNVEKNDRIDAFVFMDNQIAEANHFAVGLRGRQYADTREFFYSFRRSGGRTGVPKRQDSLRDIDDKFHSDLD